ncbi:hypothetical protein MBLNU459_g7214t1 [Dothideomycetes sp. NU459]
MSEFESPFMRLPPEIRMEIYELLLIAPARSLDTIHTTSSARVLSTDPDYHEYEYLKAPSTTNTNSGATRKAKSRRPSITLKIRIEDPAHYEQRRATHLRSHFLIRSDRFRARCMRTTYHLLTNPSLEAAILGASARLHAEAAALLYGAYTFDFDTHVEAVVPFLSDLGPLARSRVRSLRLVKRALPYEKDFDRAEWAAACDYLALNLPGLRALALGIVAGKPGPAGWDGVPPFSKTDLHYMLEMGGDGWEWVRDLLGITGLEVLDVEPVVEHCPPPMSMAMARYVRFSASIDGSFAEFLKERMMA